VVEEIAYFSEVIPEHESGQSTGREENGGGNWIVWLNPTPQDEDCFWPTSTPMPTLLTPTLTPTVKPTLTPAPTPIPAQAIYQINEVKNEEGDILSRVKIYIDGQYTHHYAPEELVFCPLCFCDSEKKVACGFGSHIIELVKDGYQEWREEKVIQAGDFYEINPTMIASAFPSPTVTATPAPSPTPFLGYYHLLAACDEKGKEVPRVKIYVDGQYIHHYLPETLVFGENCYCDSENQVACFLGKHLIELKKEGFSDWQEEVIIKAGDDLSRQPLLRKEKEEESPSLLPTLSPSLSPFFSSSLWQKKRFYLSGFRKMSSFSSRKPLAKVLGAAGEKEEPLSFSFFIFGGCFCSFYGFFRRRWQKNKKEVILKTNENH